MSISNAQALLSQFGSALYGEIGYIVLPVSGNLDIANMANNILRLGMLPFEWRQSMALSQADVAKLLGIIGKNPASTWRRYEIGERQPRMAMVAEVERLSKGKVSIRSWAAVRENFLSAAGAPHG